MGTQNWDNFNPIAGMPAYTGTSLHTSAQNIPITLFWGTRKITPNLIWWGWQSTLTYQTHAVYLPNGFKANPSLVQPAAPMAAQAIFGELTAQNPDGSQAYYGANSKADNFAWTWFVPCLFGLCEGPVTITDPTLVSGWDGPSSTKTLSGFETYYQVIPGNGTQTEFDFFSIFDPSSAVWHPKDGRLAHRGTAMIGAYFVKCTGTAYPQIPQQSFRMERWPDPAYGLVGTGDYSLAYIIPDFLTNPQYGMGLSPSDIDPVSLEIFMQYQFAQGLYFSPLLCGQDKATDIIDRWATISNSWIFYDGTIIRFVPLGDTALTANTQTYTPDLTAAYALTVNDFLDAEHPVTVDRKDPADCYNRLSIQICSSPSGNGYEAEAVEYKDEGLISQFGLRDAPSAQGDDITDILIGQIVVNLIGKRYAYIRNTYSFTLSYKYILLLPGSLVTLTEPNIGLNAALVRIQSIEEAEDGKLSIVAEEVTGTTGTATPQGSQTSGGGTTNTNEDPGSINTPAIIEPGAALTGATPAVWIAASGGPAWGGADVYISTDNTNFVRIGAVGNASGQGSLTAQGLLTATLASHADPDTVDTLSVDCTESGALLQTNATITHADADAGRTLSVIAAQPTGAGPLLMPSTWELLAYGTVASTGSYSDNLTYLRRGLYGSTLSSHAIGDQFTKLDATSLQWPLQAQYIGVPIYVKFISFNRFGNTTQSLGSVPTYEYTPTGAGFGGGTGGVPAEPTGLTAVGGAGQISVSWTPNASTDNVQYYVLYAAPGPGGSFGSAGVIFKGLATNFVYSGLPNATWYTFFLGAVNAVGGSAHTAGVDAETNPAGTGIGGVVEGVDCVADPAHPDNSHVYVQSISGAAAAGGALPMHVNELQYDALQSATVPPIMLNGFTSGVPGIIVDTQATPTTNIRPKDMWVITQAPYSGAVSPNDTSGFFHIQLPRSPAWGATFDANWQFQPNALITDVTFHVWNGVRIDGSQVVPCIGQQVSYLDLPATPFTICAQAATQTAVTNVRGGDLQLQGGIGNSTPGFDVNPSGAVRLQLHGQKVPGAASFTLFEVCEPIAGHHVTALNQYGTGITSTQMPTGTGDLVTWIGNAATVPTAAPVGGAILYATSGALWVYQSNGLNFEIQPGGVSSVTGSGAGIGVSPTTGAVVITNTGVTSITAGTGITASGTTGAITLVAGGAVTGVDVAGGNSASLYVQSISGAGGTAASVPVIFSGVTQYDFNTNGIAVDGTHEFSIVWTNTVGGPGKSIGLQPQASTGGVSGSVAALLSAPGAGTAEASFYVSRASVQLFMSAAVPGTSGAFSGIWLAPGAAQTSTPTILSDATTTRIDGAVSSHITVGGTDIAVAGASGFGIYQPIFGPGGGNGPPRWEAATQVVGGSNINLSSSLRDKILVLTGTLTVTIVITLPSTPDCMYEVNVTGVSGLGLFAIIFAAGSGVQTRGITIGSSAIIYFVYVDSTGNSVWICNGPA